MEILKDSIRLNGQEEAHNIKIVLEEDMIVKDIYPDVKNILDFDSEIISLNKRLENGKLTIFGEISVNILYLSDDMDMSLASIDEVLNFEESVTINSEAEIEDIWLDTDVTYLKVLFINSRKLNVRAVLEVGININNRASKEIVFDIEEANIEKKKIKADIEEISDVICGEAYIRDKYIIPASRPEIGLLMRSNAEINNLEVAIKGNELVLLGNVAVKLMYLSNEDGEIIYDKFNISIKEEINSDIDPEFINQSNYEIKSLVIGKNIYIAEDDNNENRDVNIDFKIEYTIVIKNNITKEVLQDAFIINKKLNFETSNINYKTLVSKNVNTVNLKEIIKVNAKDIIQIFDTKAKINVINSELKGDAAEVKGVAELSIFGVALDDYRPLIIIKEDVPFAQVIQSKNAAAGDLLKISTSIENASVNMLGSEEIEVRITFSITLDVYKDGNIKIIEDIDVEDIEDQIDDNDDSKIRIYIANKDEKIYDVAKKYNSKIEDITLVNNNEIIKNLDSDTVVNVKDKVIIF